MYLTSYFMYPQYIVESVNINHISIKSNIHQAND